MSRKQTNIIIILAVVVIGIFIGLGFLGIGGFGAPAAGTESTGAQAILDELQQTGTVAGLRAEDIAVGPGSAVKAGDTVSITYIGVLPDGTVFDSSDSQGGAPITFTVGAGEVIPGWEQGLIGMQEGGRRLLAIPPSLGYGAEVHAQVPPNSTLLFDVQLVKVVPGGSAIISVPTPPQQ
jgi:peptidylprolyl isomerase